MLLVKKNNQLVNYYFRHILRKNVQTPVLCLVAVWQSAGFAIRRLQV